MTPPRCGAAHLHGMTDSAPTNRQMLNDPAVLAAALGRHGVGQDRTPADVHGDVQHLLSPVIGRMRLQADPDLFVLERLELALALTRLAAGETCRCAHVDAAHEMRVPFACKTVGCSCAAFSRAGEVTS